jgi:hypothetical protein
MMTDDLITALVADLAISSVRFQRSFALALAMGSVLAAAAFFLWIGFRPDIAQALETVRFLFKFVVTLSLAATATEFLVRLARPGVSPGLWRWAWLVAPLLLAFAVVTELAVMPTATWWPRLVGSNARACLTLIPLLSIGPLACIFLALRQGAPTQPGFAGAVAGLVASGIAATLYASHCTDDSPLFVATWYPLAIGIVVLAGYVAGPRYLRW